jgi:hypothetical protein
MPTSFGASLLGAISRHAPAPPAVLKPVTRWGTEQGLRELFGSTALRVQVQRFRQYYRSVDHAVEVFSEQFGPIVRVREMLDRTRHAALALDLAAAFERHRRPGEATLVLECDYLQALVTR